jgi:two-component system, OmpR family, copper resistance phosphate regulon response regulator CusR
MNVLLIEDNIALAQTVTRYLAGQDIACTLRTDGKEGYQEAINNNYDVIILDIELPNMDGIEICRRLRGEGKNTPIIMLTSRATQEDIVNGLDYGADDYLPKPADYRELVARIRALSRRNFTEKSTEKISIGALEIDQTRHSITWNGFGVELSKREFELLLYFAQNRDKIITKSELSEKVWWTYDAWDDQKVVEVYIGYLRKKIDKNIIETQKGFGYRLNI